MRINRRLFIGGSALLPGALAASAAAGSAVSGAAPTAVPAAKHGDRGDGRSVQPAVQTEALARHAVGVRYADLDAGTLRKAKHRVLDLIGCAIGGAHAPGNAALVSVTSDLGGKPEASVVGYPVKASAADAALLNGVISRSYDFEVMTVVVGNKLVPSHHSPTTCMTALALSERAHLPGKDFLAALVIGDDIAARLLAASGLDFGQGWDGAPVYSSIAAAAIASRLLGSSAQQTQDAFGLVVQTIAGTVQNIWDGSTDWKLPQGLAGRNGIFAAELARRGWIGMGDALHAPYGFYAQYTAGCVEPGLLTRELGKTFYAEEYFKPYPACAATHSSIECALALRGTHGISAADVKAVVVRLPAAWLKGFVNKPFEARRHPQCDANFSTQFMVANVLLRGSVRQEHYAEALIRSPEMTALIEKISLAALPAGREGVEIELTTTDARRLVQTHSGRVSRSPAVQPSSREEIVQKFRQQVAFSGFVSTSTAEEIIRRVDGLEQEPDMAAFMQLLTRDVKV